MANERTSQVQPPVHSQGGVRFDLLGQQFAEQQLLGKIFRTYDGFATALGAATRENQCSAR